MELKAFYPGTENYKKLLWANRYSEKIMKLHDMNHKAFMMESDNWGSDNHTRIHKLQNRINVKVLVLARYSSFLTSKALT